MITFETFPCSHKGYCRNRVYQNGTLCYEHVCPNCGGQKDVTDTRCYECSTHPCGAFEMCGNRTKTPEGLCSAHKCTVCRGEKLRSQKFCEMCVRRATGTPEVRQEITRVRKTR